MGETIRAAIWLCDLRGFTSLSEALPRDALIEMLNQYFGPMCDAVESNGGEVLKFIGDAMLAIFPVVDDPATACHQALSAARRAEDALVKVNGLRATGSLPPINYGIALHFGDVIYGNIGSDTRLDFTVIGFGNWSSGSRTLRRRKTWTCASLIRKLEHLVKEDRGVDERSARSGLKLAFWRAIDGQSAAVA